MLKLVSIAAFVLMVAAIVGLALVGALFSPSPVVIAAQLAAFALLVWARITFGLRSFHAAANPTGGGLVTSGPYRYIRHPIYTAICLFGWAGMAAHPSAPALLLGGLLLASALARMLTEERLVVERYPEYREYARRTRRMVPFLFCLLAAALVVAPAWAGPPFRTDDPEPVDLHHLELYLTWTGTSASDERAGALPLVEFNYGILPDTQFHVVAPLAYDRPAGGGATRRGMGDTELGVKVRFVHETARLPQIGIFPLVEIPTGDDRRGLGAGHTQVYLPLWLQKSWGPWTTYGGAGWWRNPGTGARDWGFFGWLLQRDLGEHLTLGGELFHSTPSARGGQAATGYDLGAIVNFTDDHHLLLAAGRSFSGAGQTYFYVGYQLTAGPLGAGALRPRW